MVKIRNVWSFKNQVFVETDDGVTYMFITDDVSTVKDIRDRIKAIRKDERLAAKAVEERTIDSKLKHLKKLEGEEIE